MIINTPVPAYILRNGTGEKYWSRKLPGWVTREKATIFMEPLDSTFPKGVWHKIMCSQKHIYIAPTKSKLEKLPTI